jgi:urease accessory protein
MPVQAAQQEAGWQARLHLAFRRAPQRTVLAERRREGPLAVQRAFYPEDDLCHVYLLHPPGGVAGGDQLNINVETGRNAAALLTTPGATKFYHSVGPRARLQQNLTVTAGSLEWLPQENILFPGAEIELATHVELKDGASFIGWEMLCLGRPVIDESFDTGMMTSLFRVTRNGRPILHERLRVNGESGLGGAAGLRGNPVTGTLCATVDADFSIDALRERLSCPVGHELGMTVIDGLLVARYLGGSTEVARGLFIELWQELRPVVLGRTPCPPRIWQT